jgi:hypothetical protein
LIEQVYTRAAADGWQVVRVLGVEAEQPFALGGLNQLAFGLNTYQAALNDPPTMQFSRRFSAATRTPRSRCCHWPRGC